MKLDITQAQAIALIRKLKGRKASKGSKRALRNFEEKLEDALIDKLEHQVEYLGRQIQRQIRRRA